MACKPTIYREQAVRAVLNDLLDGATASVIYQKLMEDEYGVGFKYKLGGAKDIYKAACKRMKEDFEEDKQVIKEHMFNIVMDILTSSKLLGNHFAALQAVDRIAKLTGCYEAEKIDANINQNIVIDFGLDETSVQD